MDRRSFLVSCIGLTGLAQFVKARNKEIIAVISDERQKMFVGIHAKRLHDPNDSLASFIYGTYITIEDWNINFSQPINKEWNHDRQDWDYREIARPSGTLSVQSMKLSSACLEMMTDKRCTTNIAIQIDKVRLYIRNVTITSIGKCVSDGSLRILENVQFHIYNLNVLDAVTGQQQELFKQHSKE